MSSAEQPGYNIAVLPRFPARVDMGAGLKVVKANGVYAFSLDFASLIPADALDSPETTYIPAWSAVDDSYRRLSLPAFSSVLAGALAGTSDTELEIATGSKTFTTQAGKSWSLGQRLIAASDDGTKAMAGAVTAYDIVSGSLTLDVDYTLGSGTNDDWNISITGAQGIQGGQGDPGEGSGDVVGPSSVTDGRLVLFDGTTGKLIKQASGAPGDAAFKNTGTTAGTLAAGDDSRITGALQASGGSMTGAFVEKVVTLTDAAPVALDASLGNIFELTASANRTISPPTNPTAGQKIVIRHKASGADRTPTLSSSTGGFRFGSDITSLTATASGKTDYIGCIYHGGDNKWDVVSVSKGF